MSYLKGGAYLGGKMTSSYFNFKSALGAYYAEYGKQFLVPFHLPKTQQSLILQGEDGSYTEKREYNLRLLGFNSAIYSAQWFRVGIFYMKPICTVNSFVLSVARSCTIIIGR